MNINYINAADCQFKALFVVHWNMRLNNLSPFSQTPSKYCLTVNIHHSGFTLLPSPRSKGYARGSATIYSIEDLFK